MTVPTFGLPDAIAMTTTMRKKKSTELVPRAVQRGMGPFYSKPVGKPSLVSSVYDDADEDRPKRVRPETTKEESPAKKMKSWFPGWSTAKPVTPTSSTNVSPANSEDEAPVQQKHVCDRCDGDHETSECPYFQKERDDHPDALQRTPRCANMGLDGGNAFLQLADVVPQPGDGSCLFHALGDGYSRLHQSKDHLFQPSSESSSSLSPNVSVAAVSANLESAVKPKGSVLTVEPVNTVATTSLTTSSSSMVVYPQPRPAAPALRGKLMDWLLDHEDDKIAETPVKDWVKWDSGCSVPAYAKKMRIHGWGGGIEMAAFAHLFNVEVHVYEKQGKKVHDYPYKRISRFAREPTTKDDSTDVVNVLYCGGVHYDSLVARSPMTFVDQSTEAPKVVNRFVDRPKHVSSTPWTRTTAPLTCRSTNPCISYHSRQNYVPNHRW